DVSAALEPGEGAGRALTLRLGDVDVARGGDTDRPPVLHMGILPEQPLLHARHRGYERPVASEDQPLNGMVPTLKRAAAALRDAGVPFLVAGGVASWVRGGPRTDHDLDFLVKPDDAERALAVLAETGMRPERPPEEWLFKA